jgi:proteic killer suppression protein
MSNVPGNCHALSADRRGQYAVHLWGAMRLVFEPAHDPLPKLQDGGIDIKRITRINIGGILDYHGK